MQQLSGLESVLLALLVAFIAAAVGFLQGGRGKVGCDVCDAKHAGMDQRFDSIEKAVEKTNKLLNQLLSEGRHGH